MTHRKKQVRISELIIPKYLPLFNDRNHKHIILTSGRAGTKSSFAAIRGDYQIVADAHGSVVVLRKHHNKLRKTVYKEMLRGINRLEIPKNKFYITRSPMEITYNRHGTTMYFAGSDGIDDTKGIIDEDKPIKLVIVDELTEFFDDGEGEEELANIEATFVRGNSSGFQMIYLYNPPKNPNAPINQWCKKMEQRDDCIHIHTDYRDVPSEWLGQDLIDTALEMEKNDPKMYRWVWLGESTGVDDLIYYMFCDAHRREPDASHYKLIGIGVDYGQQNATTYQAAGININKRKIEGLDEFYHSGRESGRQKSPSDYAKELIKFTDALHEEYAADEEIRSADGYSAGLDYGSGFALGIKDSEGNIRVAAWGAGAAALGSTRESIDSNSPAKETIDIGHDYGDGYVIGINDREKDVRKASERLGNASLHALDMAAISSRMRESLSLNTNRVARSFAMESRSTILSKQQTETLMRMSDADIERLALGMGRVTADEMNKKQKSNWKGYVYSEVELTFIAPELAWVKEVKKMFPPQAESAAADGLDFPFDFPFDFADARKGSATWEIDHVTASDFQVIIYGPCVNPKVLINDHTYEVFTTLEANEYMIIDSRDYTVYKYLANGTEQNLFDNRGLEQSIFDKIPSGMLRINWSGDFGFDLTLFLERREAQW